MTSSMPPEIQSLHTVLAHAERERDLALSALHRAEAAEQGGLRQVEMLTRYGLEYDERWGARQGREGSTTMLHCVHGFVQRLDQARTQQTRQCQLLAERSAQARTRLQATELRVAAIRKLIERRMDALRVKVDRAAQRQTDEAAQRIAWAARDAHPARSC